MAFTAEYPGECLSCGEDIKPGQQINSTGRGYVHEVCPNQTPERGPVFCSGCFLELPTSGICGVCE